MSTKVIYFMMVAFMLISCKKEVSQKIAAVEPQLVVQSFFAPGDDSIRVELDYSKNYFGDQQNRSQLLNSISKAIVQVESGGSTKTLTWSEKNRYFTVSTREMPLIQNADYHLNVTTLEGLKAEATTTVPSLIEEVELTKTVGKTKDQSRTDRITLRIKDEKGKKNYYQFRLFSYFAYTVPEVFNEYHEIGQKLDNDNNDLSENVIASFNNDVYLNNGGGGSGVVVEATYRAFFIKATEEYYKYLQISKDNNNAGGNPFAEPVPIYTNIKGGLGVFASYQIQERRMAYP